MKMMKKREIRSNPLLNPPSPLKKKEEKKKKKRAFRSNPLFNPHSPLKKKMNMALPSSPLISSSSSSFLQLQELETMENNPSYSWSESNPLLNGPAPPSPAPYYWDWIAKNKLAIKSNPVPFQFEEVHSSSWPCSQEEDDDDDDMDAEESVASRPCTPIYVSSPVQSRYSPPSPPPGYEQVLRIHYKSQLCYGGNNDNDAYDDDDDYGCDDELKSTASSRFRCTQSVHVSSNSSPLPHPGLQSLPMYYNPSRPSNAVGYICPHIQVGC